MRIQILGGGNNQLNAIIRAKQKGHEVVLTDYYKNPPGRIDADFNECLSTFDVPGNIEVAKRYQVDGVMTVGTDQPVFTVASVAADQKLPAFLDIDVAAAVTNKKIMKKIFSENQIPTVSYQFISAETLASDLARLNFPVVLKPLDSQGQRGIYKLNTAAEVIAHLSQTLSFSRQKTALVEEYYQSDEITVSAWVTDKKATILTVTDRLRLALDKHIGICYAHEFPSKYATEDGKIKSLITQITDSFGIQNGPLYVQLLVGKSGILVNEVACRIGGAYEDIFIPYLTGFDILDRVIDYSLGIERGEKPVCFSSSQKHLSVQLFFAKPGPIKQLTKLKDLKKCPGVIAAGYNISENQTLAAINNATARAGYLIVVGENQADLKDKVSFVFDYLKILDDKGENLLMRF